MLTSHSIRRIKGILFELVENFNRRTFLPTILTSLRLPSQAGFAFIPIIIAVALLAIPVTTVLVQQQQDSRQQAQSSSPTIIKGTITFVGSEDLLPKKVGVYIYESAFNHNDLGHKVYTYISPVDSVNYEVTIHPAENIDEVLIAIFIDNYFHYQTFTRGITLHTVNVLDLTLDLTDYYEEIGDEYCSTSSLTYYCNGEDIMVADGFNESVVATCTLPSVCSTSKPHCLACQQLASAPDPSDKLNDPNSCTEYDNRNNTFSCKNSCTAGIETNMGNGGAYKCASATYCCRNDDLHGKYYGSSTSPQTPFTGVGYCADADRKSPIIVGGATCDIQNETSYDSSGDDYCKSYAGSLQKPLISTYFYRCLTSGGGSPDPGSGSPTTRPGPDSGPCAKDKGGVKEYKDAFCNGMPYDFDKAAADRFCGGTYTDLYICNNLDPATGKNYEDHYKVPLDLFPDGKSPCDKNPWCPKNAPKKDPANCVHLGVSCDSANPCCSLSENLVCVDPSGTGFPACHYNTDPDKGPVGAFTPTPGEPSKATCEEEARAGLGMSAGCDRCNNFGCNSAKGLGCYPEAENGNIYTGPFYCSPIGTYWCAKSKTYVSKKTDCSGPIDYVPPTPTPKDLSYQAECPRENPNGTTNICATSCTTGFTPKPSGDQVCAEFTSGQNPKCCTQNAVGANTPTPTRAFTPPTPTPTPFTSSSKPTGPYISFDSVPACPTGHNGFWRGTYCDTDKVYYDVNCENGVKKRIPIGSITCQ